MQQDLTVFQQEVNSGVRFRFGKNWRHFLQDVDEERIRIAEKSLVDFYQVNDFKGKTFLDVGCGSGLFSLAACRLGAEVFSIDFDPDSVWCVNHLKQQFFPRAAWHVKQGSVLDIEFMKSVGEFDYVYSWGVLHHTGNLALALKNVMLPMKDDAKLFIGIYNDQGGISKAWKKVKELYNWNIVSGFIVSSIFISYWTLKFILSSLLRGRNPLQRYQEYRRRRGMSLYHDWIDWLGGLPFEVAKAGDIVDFYSKLDLQLTKIATTNSLGINQFVFARRGCLK